MKKIFALMGSLMLLSAAPLCAADYAPDSAPMVSPDILSLGHLAYQAGEALVTHPLSAVSKNKAILVSSVVNLNKLEHSSAFGREVSRLVASRLTQLGYVVRDLNYTRAVRVVPRTGELALSREAELLIQDMDAQAVVVGSYAYVGKQIFVNLRMVNADNGIVISSSDFVVLAGGNVSGD